MIRNSVNTCNGANGYFSGFSTGNVAKSLASLPVVIFRGLVEWQRRALDRANLKTMDGHLLKDIGLVREDVAREVSKPFWRS